MRTLFLSLPLLWFLSACTDTPPVDTSISSTAPVEGSARPAEEPAAGNKASPDKADAFVPVADLPTVTQRTFFHERNAPVQLFQCSARRDTVLTGSHGTRLHIAPGTFVDSDGRPMTGQVHLRLREALDPFTIVDCGLYTTYGDRPLESGGMLEVQASSDKGPLRIADGHAIGVEVPTADRLSGMSVFAGRKTANGIAWVEPEPIAEEERVAVAFPLQVVVEQEPIDVKAVPTKVPDVSWTVKYYPADQPPAAIDRWMVERFALKGDSLRFPPDSAFVHNGWNVRLHPGNERCGKLMRDYLDEKARFARNEQLGRIRAIGPGQAGWDAPDGTNGFQVDQQSAYVFGMKKLGWANIDRLMRCPNTQAVDLITEVPNAKDFGTVYISMIVPKHRMFLPGYRKADGTFGFSHGDSEQMRLPVGDEAIILATAYVDGQPWYAQRSIRISSKQEVNLELQQTTAEKLREELMATL